MSEKFDTEIWDIDRLKPYDRNAKKHDKAKISDIAGLILKHGFTNPIQVERDGTIIAGHGRRLAAIEAGLTRVPVWIFKGTKVEAAALRLADNAVVSKDYDLELLQSELGDLSVEGYDVSGIGFSEKELEFMTVPLENMDEGAFVEDVHTAVEEHRDANEERAREVDAATAPLADAFGFRRFTTAQSRKVRAFMTQIEAESGLKGPEALIGFIDGLAA